MVRDGRATVHSIISRKVTITGFDLTSYRQCMKKWNHAIEVMHDQCKEMGKDRCMMVNFKNLIKLFVYAYIKNLFIRFIMNNWFCIQRNG